MKELVTKMKDLIEYETSIVHSGCGRDTGSSIDGIDLAAKECAAAAIDYAIGILKSLEGPIGQGMMDASSLDSLLDEIKIQEENRINIF